MYIYIYVYIYIYILHIYLYVNRIVNTLYTASNLLLCSVAILASRAVWLLEVCYLIASSSMCMRGTEVSANSRLEHVSSSAVDTYMRASTLKR